MDQRTFPKLVGQATADRVHRRQIAALMPGLKWAKPSRNTPPIPVSCLSIEQINARDSVRRRERVSVAPLVSSASGADRLTVGQGALRGGYSDVRAVRSSRADTDLRDAVIPQRYPQASVARGIGTAEV